MTAEHCEQVDEGDGDVVKVDARREAYRFGMSSKQPEGHRIVHERQHDAHWQAISHEDHQPNVQIRIDG